MRIPNFKGRPLILFPSGWQRGWLSPTNPDPNAALSHGWSPQGWLDFREEYYLNIVPCPFGYHPDLDSPWVDVPYAPWGMSRTHGEPKLHPDDE